MKKAIFVPLFGLLLASCVEETPLSSTVESSFPSSSEVPSLGYKGLSVISPMGAPTLALYSEAKNENFETTSVTSNVMAAVKTATSKDAVIFDGLNALKLTKSGQTQTPWKLARWLTGGNFYIVSTKHTLEEGLISGGTFLSFGNGNLPDKVFHKLCESSWNFDPGERIDYRQSTGEVASILGSEQYASYDYYFIAEPSLSAAKANLKAKHPEVTINEIYNLRAEWKSYSGMEAIPQAGLFLNGKVYEDKKEAFEGLLKKVDENLLKVTDSPEEAVSELDSLEPDLEKQASKLGYKSTVIASLQKEGGNRLGVIKPGAIPSNRDFINLFNEKMGEGVRFDESLFLS